MTPRERRAFAVASVLLLSASGVRALHEARREAPVLPPDSAGILDSLGRRTRAARAEAERRKRPLDEGERLDPNRAPEADLDRLPGVGPSVARAIVAARDSGPPFRGPGDLTRVRGIGPATATRIAPHLDFSRPPPLGAGGGSGSAGVGGGSRFYGVRPVLERASPEATTEAEVVELNGADRLALESLPGIGPALAGRILEERSRRGGFRTVEELLAVRGVGPVTLERIRTRVRVVPP